MDYENCAHVTTWSILSIRVRQAKIIVARVGNFSETLNFQFMWCLLFPWWRKSLFTWCKSWCDKSHAKPVVHRQRKLTVVCSL
jgi:hypothetical protein